MEAASLDKTETGAPPRHLAIIMDGNGRWAKARGLPRTAGHQHGAEAVRRSIEGAVELGIRYLTLFGFSSENWKRPADEVKDLMGLLRFYLKSEIRKLRREGVRFRVIGDRDRLDADIVALIEEAEGATAANSRLGLVIALSYGSRAEIASAARAIARKAAAGEIAPDAIDEATVANHLYTADIPDPDLLIRTSGEQRISNF
ncbi:MAG: polyprenyl diphosphate synthase, partial [Rhodospirillaceae bacterium]